MADGVGAEHGAEVLQRLAPAYVDDEDEHARERVDQVGDDPHLGRAGFPGDYLREPGDAHDDEQFGEKAQPGENNGSN